MGHQRAVQGRVVVRVVRVRDDDSRRLRLPPLRTIEGPAHLLGQRLQVFVVEALLEGQKTVQSKAKRQGMDRDNAKLIVQLLLIKIKK